MDGPGEATRQSAWPEATRLPRNRGKSRGSAAIMMRLNPKFCGQFRPGLCGLLHYKYPCKVQRTGRPEASQGPKLGFF